MWNSTSFLARLFSKKTSGYFHSPGGVVVVRCRGKTLTFSNISVFTGYVHENQNSCSLSKGELIPVGEVILQFFFDKVMPIFRLRIFSCWHPHAVLLLGYTPVTFSGVTAPYPKSLIIWRELLLQLTSK